MTDPHRLLDRPVAQIARAVSAEPALAQELAAVAGERITRVNPHLNAVVDVVEAPSIGVRGALAGVPTLLKDLQADAGDTPLRRGSRVFADAGPSRDSTLVARVRAEGATVLGRTNTPEFGTNCVTEPLLWGPCRNPWNPERTPGGSSGGAAAAVAAGLVPVAHATDSGGSIRIPAAWSGVVGFKPSRGSVAAGRQRLDDWFGFSHEHVITRTVEDARFLFALAGSRSAGEWQPWPAQVTPPARPLRIGFSLRGPRDAPLHPDYVSALRAVTRALRSRGHDLTEVDAIEEASEVGGLFGNVVAAHLAAHAAREPALPWHLLEPVNSRLRHRGAELSASDIVETVRSMHRLSFAIADRMAGFDALLTTTAAWPAPAVGAMPTDGDPRELIAEIFRLAPTPVVSNLTGGAAISVPWGLDAEGMPIGIHLAAGIGADSLLLDLAQTIEDDAPPLPAPRVHAAR